MVYHVPLWNAVTEGSTGNFGGASGLIHLHTFVVVNINVQHLIFVPGIVRGSAINSAVISLGKYRFIHGIIRFEIL